jgi:hypothetical protein
LDIRISIVPGRRTLAGYKDELIDYSIRSGAPLEVVENLQELDDEGDVYETIEDIWPDYPTQEDFLFNEDEY